MAKILTDNRHLYPPPPLPDPLLWGRGSERPAAQTLQKLTQVLPREKATLYKEAIEENMKTNYKAYEG